MYVSRSRDNRFLAHGWDWKRNFFQNGAVGPGGCLQDTLSINKKNIAPRSKGDAAYELIEFLGVDGGAENVKIALPSVPFDGYDEMGKFTVSQENVADVDPPKLYLLKPVLVFVILALEFVGPGVASL